MPKSRDPMGLGAQPDPAGEALKWLIPQFIARNRIKSQIDNTVRENVAHEWACWLRLQQRFDFPKDFMP